MLFIREVDKDGAFVRWHYAGQWRALWDKGLAQSHKLTIVCPD